MYLIAHIDECEVNVTPITRWSAKCINQSLITVTTPSSNGGGGRLENRLLILILV